MATDLEALKDFATPRQAEIIDAVISEGSHRKAAVKLGINPRNVDRVVQAVRTKAASQGHAPGHWDSGVAPGYRMGKVTVQRGPVGVERVWERQHPEQSDREEAIRRFVEDLVDNGARGASTIVPAPAVSDPDLLTAYLFGDPHFGMRAMRAEAGEDFDLAEADRLMRASIDYMVERSPPSGTGLLVEIGDYFHADDSTNATPKNRNPLDVDGRFFNITQVGLLALVYAINRMKAKHPRVVVLIIPGNHDPHSSWMLALCLHSFFLNDARVEIDLDPGLYKYFRFGKNLFGAHHGHGAKITELGEIMASDCPTDWGETEHRIFWMGHIHHKKALELRGLFVESLNTLAPSDAWHRGEGYRSSRSTQMVVFDAQHGESERHRCNVSRLAKPDAPVLKFRARA